MSRKIISSLDIGSGFIKLVIGEYFENRLHILSASKIANNGIERGHVVNEDDLISSIKKSISDAESVLGVKIDKCILGLNMINAKLAKSGSAVKIKNELNKINGDNVTDLMNKIADGKIPVDYVLAGISPVEWTIDGDKVVKNPFGLISENLGLKGVIICLPRDYVSTMLDVANKAGLKVIDVVPNAVGDYEALKTHLMNESNGAIVDIGSQMTTVTIFNKGIITNTKAFPLGVKNIIKDISFVTKLDDDSAEAIYKDIVLSNSRLANPNEYRIVTDLNGEEVKINQFDISEVASSRIDEILNMAKKQINVLTKKEISYIIVTGGLTELRDFNLSLEKVFGKNASIGKLNYIGARDNSFTSAIGNANAFLKKMEYKGKGFSIFSEEDLEALTAGQNEINSNNNSLFSKVFGYFFDN